MTVRNECREEGKKMAECLLGSEDEDEVDREYERSLRRFKKIMEEDRKREERLKTERMVGSKQMAN
jgi:hypothetical protein